MTEYQKNLVRMWDSLRVENKGAKNCSPILCKQCPFNEVVCITVSYTGDNYTSLLFNAEKAIEVVDGWAKEHPLVTYEQKYEETFGVKPLQIDRCTKNYLCPKHAGFDISINCNAQSCEKCKQDFWSAEYKPPVKEGE